MTKPSFAKLALNLSLVVLLLLTIIPLVLLIFLSTKDNLDILTDFWGIPDSIKWANFTNAYEAVKQSIGNTLFIAVVSIAGSLTLASLSGYVFARHKFPLKGFLFSILIGVMMIPGLLTLVPLYSLIVKLHLTHTFWGLILPYIASQQLFGVLITRTFFESLPEDLFEAARMDGGSEFYLYSRIALPLSVPILITIGIISFLGIYGDYLWPSIVLNDSQRTFSIAAVSLTSAGRVDIGLSFGAYILGSIPTILILLFGMKYYVQGIMAGSVKG